MSNPASDLYYNWVYTDQNQDITKVVKSHT